MAESGYTIILYRWEALIISGISGMQKMPAWPFIHMRSIIFSLICLICVRLLKKIWHQEDHIWSTWQSISFSAGWYVEVWSLSVSSHFRTVFFCARVRERTAYGLYCTRKWNLLLKPYSMLGIFSWWQWLSQWGFLWCAVLWSAWSLLSGGDQAGWYVSVKWLAQSGSALRS